MINMGKSFEDLDLKIVKDLTKIINRSDDQEAEVHHDSEIKKKRSMFKTNSKKFRRF